jgi:CRP/FNR family transcriptional regulator, cyclic AMP receptor protein
MSETERQGVEASKDGGKDGKDAGKDGKEAGSGSASGSGKAPHGREGPSVLDILARLDLFDGMAALHLGRVVAIGAEERHSRGATIFEEGETGDKFYVILDGAVRISRFVAGLGEEALAVLRPGAYFGEMSLIDDESRSAAAIAHESCRLFVLKRPDLEDLLFVDRDLAYEFLWKMVRTLSRRLRATNDKMTFLASTNKF